MPVDQRSRRARRRFAGRPAGWIACRFDRMLHFHAGFSAEPSGERPAAAHQSCRPGMPELPMIRDGMPGPRRRRSHVVVSSSAGYLVSRVSPKRPSCPAFRRFVPGAPGSAMPRRPAGSCPETGRAAVLFLHVRCQRGLLPPSPMGDGAMQMTTAGGCPMHFRRDAVESAAALRPENSGHASGLPEMWRECAAERAVASRGLRARCRCGRCRGRECRRGGASSRGRNALREPWCCTDSRPTRPSHRTRAAR